MKNTLYKIQVTKSFRDLACLADDVFCVIGATYQNYTELGKAMQNASRNLEKSFHVEYKYFDAKEAILTEKEFKLLQRRLNAFKVALENLKNGDEPRYQDTYHEILEKFAFRGANLLDFIESTQAA